jgi:ATP-dependent DNA helicase DinG
MGRDLDIKAVFAAQGPLRRGIPGFVARAAQARMAQRVHEAMQNREPLIVEAGTGTGKTFAYLVPALLGGLRVLISTGTRALQDQLYARDLPQLAAVLGRPARVALLKGRSNYLCRLRFENTRQQQALAGLTRSDGTLERLGKWADVTDSGDLAEVPGLSDSSSLWQDITSTRDNCLGQRCGKYGDCHVVAARRRAQEADIVVVNHHLLLADLALKQEGFADLLGSADAVVLDEAHQIPDLAMQFFGASISSRQLENLLADTRAGLTRAAIPVADLQAALRAVEDAIAELANALPRGAGRLELNPQLTEFALAGRQLLQSLQSLSQALGAANVARDNGLQLCAERATLLADTASRVVDDEVEPGARASELHARGFTVSLLPFDIAERFRGMTGARPSAWIFASATLSVGDDFSHFASRLGLDAAATLRIDSPFNYETQALLFLPEKMPEPASREYTGAMLQAIWPLVSAAGGGAFLLFTSHRALTQAASLLRGGLCGAIPGPLLVQGEAPREKILREFRAAGNAVLLGTASFWEGVDVKGDALRLVVIDKLPFASPDDPIVRARSEYLRRMGGNPFGDYQLPEAALALKQGVGRVIRSEDDRGVVAICDPRLLAKGYGRVFRACLPPMPVTRDAAEACRFLKAMSRAA